MSAWLLDALVLLAYFAAIMGIGLSQRSKSGSVHGFALGDRNIAWWAVLASILAAEISAATFLGAPGEGFAKRNWTYAQLVLGTILARVLVSVIFIPVYYRHGVTSIYEYLETRFGGRTRLFASMTFIVTRVLAMGTRLYVSAIILVLAMEMFQGRSVSPQEKFWLYAGAVVAVTVLTAIYTSVGGIKAVIWTDFIQVGVLVASLGFAIWYLLGRMPGGWDSVTAQIKEPVFLETLLPLRENEGLLAWFGRVLREEYSLYTALIGSTFVTLATHGIDQDTVQRMLTARNKRQSMFATILSGIVDLPVVSAFILIGILLSAFYANNPPPDLPKESREIFPYFILHEMPPGLRGLVTAGVLATAMGSLSTALNALATSCCKDFFFRGREDSWSEARRVGLLRWTTVLFAILIIVVGVWTAYYTSMHPDVRIIPLVLGILGFTFGSLLGVFLVAVFTRSRGNDTGNIIAMICGFAAVAFMSIKELQMATGFTRFDPATGTDIPALIIAFPWRITLGTLVTVAVALCFRTPQAKQHEAAQVA
jgi:SSS family transporter